jgi:hypothetical protein
VDLARGKAKVQGLEKELIEAKKNLQMESDELGVLSAIIRVVYDDLDVMQSKGTSLLALASSRSQIGCANLGGMPIMPASIDPL